MDGDHAYQRALCEGGTRRPRPGDRAAAQNTHHNDVAVYALDADPATGMAYRVAQLHDTDASGGGGKFCRRRLLRVNGPKVDL